MNLKKYLNLTFDYHLFITKFIQIGMILIGAILIYYFVVLIVKRIFSIKINHIKMKDYDFVHKRKQTLEKIILSLWRYFVYVMTFLLCLSKVGINIQTILAGAGILGVVFAVGSQHLLQDFLEGFFNIFENNISVGDYVEIDKVEGNIIDIGLRTIKIKSFTGEVHIVPNSKIGHIINYSLDFGKALVDILISYDSELSDAVSIINQALIKFKNENKNIISDPTIMGVNRLDALGYEIRIMCTTIKETQWSVQRFMRGELIKIFKENNIQIGKNQITVINSHNLDT